MFVFSKRNVISSIGSCECQTTFYEVIKDFISATNYNIYLFNCDSIEGERDEFNFINPGYSSPILYIINKGKINYIAFLHHRRSRVAQDPAQDENTPSYQQKYTPTFLSSSQRQNGLSVPAMVRLPQKKAHIKTLGAAVCLGSSFLGLPDQGGKKYIDPLTQKGIQELYHYSYTAHINAESEVAF